MKFYFPLLLLPFDTEDVLGDGCSIRVLKRKWHVSIIDLYSMVAAEQVLRMPAELINVFLGNVSSEVEIEAKDFKAAAEELDCFRAMLYLQGIAPTVLPFASNYSINSYAGINERSAGLEKKLPDEIKTGITNNTARVEFFPYELSLTCLRGSAEDFKKSLDNDIVTKSINNVVKWHSLENNYTDIKLARRALVKAPLMPDLPSSILQIWQGIESIFPAMNAELNFRISLMLSEILFPLFPRMETFKRAKMSYNIRSSIAHGRSKEITMKHWLEAWTLLRDLMSAVLLRGTLPSEEELLENLLQSKL